MRGANDELLETATKAAFELVVEDLACILSSSLSVRARHAQGSGASAGINQLIKKILSFHTYLAHHSHILLLMNA